MRAKPVTPENPVPRRTFSVPADYPDEAAAIGARGTVTVRVVIDESGRVAETRVAGLSIHMPDASFSLAGGDPGGTDRLLSGAYSGREDRREAARAAFAAITESATRAVSRWLYAPPEDGPLAFSVDVHVGAAPPPPPAAPPAPSSRTRAALGVAPPPPPPPPPAFSPDQAGGNAAGAGAETRGWAMTDGALRIGGNIKAPRKLVHVAPVYPPIAQSARVQGVVILETRIEADGTVSDVRVLRSIPLLDEAAIASVRQWRFEPTLLNGAPVAVMMTTTVNFMLE
jgi:protein TonB